jgi:hypothetical protein
MPRLDATSPVEVRLKNLGRRCGILGSRVRWSPELEKVVGLEGGPRRRLEEGSAAMRHGSGTGHEWRKKAAWPAAAAIGGGR